MAERGRAAQSLMLDGRLLRPMRRPERCWTRADAPSCVHPDARRPIMCVPGCQEALHAALSRRGFFRGAAAAGFAATAIVPAEAQRSRRESRAAAGPRRRRAELLQGRGRSDPHHVAGLPDLLRRAGHRVAEAVRLQEGRLQSELVEDHRACRHPSRCADPFLGGRRHRRQDRRRRAGGAARRHRRAQAGREGCRLSRWASRTC